MLAWHFLKADRKLRYYDGREVVDGEELEMKPVRSNSHDGGQITEPILCVSGMHASVKLRDALQYAPGLVLCRVDVTGDFEFPHVPNGTIGGPTCARSVPGHLVGGNNPGRSPSPCDGRP